MQKLKKNCPRAIAILLSLMMMVVFVPTFAFAADGGSITVFMTVSNQGQLAKANDGSPMANKEVTVTDVDGDGHFTFHEALVAVHKAYNSEEGYSGSSGQYGFSVTKVWGVENGGSYLFYDNDEGLSTGVDGAEVNNGDYLTASVMVDTNSYSDWYSTFDAKEKTTETGSTVSLTLKGHLGMAYEPEDMNYVALPGITVKDTNGTEYGKTDANGKVNLTFSKAGTYVITADGVVKDYTASIYSYPGGQTEDGKYYVTDTSMNYLYTDEDFGDGPYPADKIKKMNMTDFFDLEDDEIAAMHLVYANKYVSQYEAYYPALVDAPIMAPACIVTVKPAEAVQPAAPAQPSEVKDLPAVKITKAKKAKKAFTVKWKKVSKKNKKKIAGIEVQYSLTKSFSNPITKTAKKTKTSLKVKKLSAKTNYYVRVRAYKNENGVKHISAWSKVKKVKTK